jgi:hypothetical protein
VTARNTPQIHCGSAQALQRCQRLYEHLKAVGLPAFGMEDDLAKTPHNVYLKIQYGGLLGLQALSNTAAVVEGKIADIHGLIDAVTRGDEGTEDFSFYELTPYMLNLKTKRRRTRKR